MKAQLLRFASSGLHQSWTTPFHYSVLVTATLLPKLLHLYTHITSLPILLILLYLPTFFVLDVVNAAAFWALLHWTARGRSAVLLAVFKILLGFIVLGASSVQIAFYLETGGDIKWGAASNFAHDPAGYKLLLSGGIQAMSVAIVIIVIARVISGTLYNVVGGLVAKVSRTFCGSCFPSSSSQPVELSYDESGQQTPLHSESTLYEDDADFTLDDLEKFDAITTYAETQRKKRLSRWLSRLLFLLPILAVTILLAVRPRKFPYTHMSASLPYTLFSVLSPYSQDMCQATSSREFPPFPLADLIVPEFWETPNDEFIGWMPYANSSTSSTGPQNITLPSWLPSKPVPGFDRWYDQPPTFDHPPRRPKHPGSGPKHHRPHHNHHKHHYEDINYDPVRDPMRISNLDSKILGPITEALKSSNVNIKHVVILCLESTRKDVFPFKKDSFLHDVVAKTHGTEESLAKANFDLSQLTRNAELLTGEESGFDLEEEVPYVNGTWRNLSKDKGGLNVMGAFTGSTSTFKSMLGSHCGVQPLPVDFTVEAGGNIYQPCLPSILDLLNRNKESKALEGGNHKGNEDDLKSRPWKSVFIQSITDKFDRQDELSERMGFSTVIVKDTLLDPESPYFPPNEPESNYFGFPERQAKPYLRDVFKSAIEKDERLFLSHFTSSTHHPWNTPAAAGKTVDYLQRSKWRSEHSLNKYLNTIKYDDGWIGEIMDMLDEFSITDQTLVVMVGDHGYAFEEDSKIHATFENGHISNMRVPLLFYHRSLPRIQLSINATSLSIIPTILDLLATTSSLTAEDTTIAKGLMQQYEGQSLIRPFVTTRNGRQQWNIGVLNAGGALLSVSSSAVPYRLILPICKSGSYRFTNTDTDPNEVSPLEMNSISSLAKAVKLKYGDGEAAKWVEEAEKIGKWWVLEQRRRWRFTGAALQDDRKAEELRETGKVKGMHWWET